MNRRDFNKMLALAGFSTAVLTSAQEKEEVRNVSLRIYGETTSARKHDNIFGIFYRGIVEIVGYGGRHWAWLTEDEKSIGDVSREILKNLEQDALKNSEGIKVNIEYANFQGDEAKYTGSKAKQAFFSKMRQLERSCKK